MYKKILQSIKRTGWVILLLVFLVSSICACGQISDYRSQQKKSEIDSDSTDNIVGVVVEESSENERIVDFSKYPGGTSDSSLFYLNTVKEFTTGDLTVREEIGITVDAVNRVMQESVGKYCYDMLSPNEKQLYVEILLVLQNLGEEILVCSTDVEMINKVFQCVMGDHPEIFYVAGYTYTMHNRERELLKITFSGNYTKSKEDIQTCQVRIDIAASECMSGLDLNADDYAKVKHVYEYVISNTEYDLNALENQNICSVFIYHRSVCQGYAKAVQYLLNLLHVPCTLVIGEVSSRENPSISGFTEEGEGHAWNLVKVDNVFYYVDATWGDPSYTTTENEISKYPPISYDYLCITTEELNKTHQIDNPVSMPWCNAMNANYYYREGLYFDSVDMEKMTKVFQNAYGCSNEYITIKCSSSEVYRKMYEELFTNQQIFALLSSGSESVSYVENEEQYTLCIWL